MAAAGARPLTLVAELSQGSTTMNDLATETSDARDTAMQQALRPVALAD